MAYPPSVPPATRTDTTPQFTNHPGDHNQISAALTEILNHLAAVEAAEAERNRRVGVGIFTGSQFVGTQTNPLIIYNGEAYDTDGFHAANSTDVIIPAGLDGVYSCTMTVVLNGPMTAGPFSGLVRIITPSGAIKQNTIVSGQTIATVNYTGPLAAAGKLQTSFFNGGDNNFLAASLEVLRVAL
jgi:hypothetical protein